MLLRWRVSYNNTIYLFNNKLAVADGALHVESNGGVNERQLNSSQNIERSDIWNTHSDCRLSASLVSCATSLAANTDGVKMRIDWLNKTDIGVNTSTKTSPAISLFVEQYKTLINFNSKDCSSAARCGCKRGAEGADAANLELATCKHP